MHLVLDWITPMYLMLWRMSHNYDYVSDVHLNTLQRFLAVTQEIYTRHKKRLAMTLTGDIWDIKIILPPLQTPPQSTRGSMREDSKLEEHRFLVS
ncbi:hypothetical protein FKM82_012770 [Ascaphus truei]